jgi:F-type H+-transporting ATPase subunit b
MVLHVINLFLLYVILRYLVYEPVRKFMQKRQQRLEDDRGNVQKLQEEATKITSESQAILNRAKDESRAIINEGAIKAKENADAILHGAAEKAKQIAEEARQEAEHERQVLRQELRGQVGELAVKIAETVIKREVKPEDNAAVIDAFFHEGERT